GWYHPDATFGDAFAALMSHLLGERSPLWVDALLPELKQAQIPLLRRLVEQRSEVTAAFTSRDREIEQRSYPLQIRPHADAGPLFVQLDQQRRRVLRRSEDRIGLRGLDTFDESVDWLLDVIETEPGRVSPGVRARVAIQDALFGSDLLILGPGELSYLPQAAPLYELLSLTPPTVVLRPQALVLEGHQLDKLASTKLDLEAFTSPDLDLDQALVDSESTRFLGLAGEDLVSLLERLRQPALEIDANLDNPWSKTGDQMKRALEAFSGRVTAAASRRDEVARQRAESLRRVCLPLGKSQERVIATAHYPGRHGDRFVDAMFEHLGLDPRYLRVIQP
ncbi:MAG: bacillithiol biosynthesis BshC, partial [Acidobacteriota bacterium]